MKKVIRIDENGMFIEDVILNDAEITPSDCVDVDCAGGFYHPKWDGTTWVEGLTQAEIDALQNIVSEPTIDERLSAMEEALLMLI